MKKPTFIFSSFLIVIFVFTSGMTLNRKDKELIGEKMPLEKFTAINIAIPASVFIKQGNTHEVEIDADEKTMDKLLIEVRDGKLFLEKKEGIQCLKSEIEVHITLKELEKLAVAGSADVLGENSFKAEILALNISGSGNIDFEDLKAQEVNVKISGSGKMNFRGKGSEEMNISIAGSGDLDSENFPVRELDCKITGSGKCRVNVDGEINASIAGSGSIFYRGNAEVNSNILGSGKIAKI